jgi:hypothetical protein
MIKFINDVFLTEVYKLVKAEITNTYKNIRPEDYANPSCVIRFRNSSYDFPIQDGYLQILMYRDLFSNKSIDSSGHETMKNNVMQALSSGVTITGGSIYYFEPLSSGAPLIMPESPQESFQEVRFKVRLVEYCQ